ncbi:MAG: hypothetical protein GF398_12200 [Chitinivibrionales bacterium]|nr:hypothetical protein [Chitinivibrionales bacterium]
MSPVRQCGIVRFFNMAKGFGRIARRKGPDVYVHYKAIRGEGYRDLEEGQRVEFVLVQGSKGWEASDVVSLE